MSLSSVRLALLYPRRPKNTQILVILVVVPRLTYSICDKWERSSHRLCIDPMYIRYTVDVYTSYIYIVFLADI